MLCEVVGDFKTFCCITNTYFLDALCHPLPLYRLYCEGLSKPVHTVGQGIPLANNYQLSQLRVSQCSTSNPNGWQVSVLPLYHCDLSPNTPPNLVCYRLLIHFNPFKAVVPHISHQTEVYSFLGALGQTMDSLYTNISAKTIIKNVNILLFLHTEQVMYRNIKSRVRFASTVPI